MSIPPRAIDRTDNVTLAWTEQNRTLLVAEQASCRRVTIHESRDTAPTLYHTKTRAALGILGMIDQSYILQHVLVTVEEGRKQDHEDESVCQCY